MSTYEKIASSIIAVFVILGVAFSFHEIREPERGASSMPEAPRHASDFDDSIGSGFRIGSFSRLSSVQSSGAADPNCAPLTPIILGVLHDIDVRLLPPREDGPRERGGKFMVTESVLRAFCSASTTVTVLDDSGNTLLLVKHGFQRIIPPGGTSGDIGTDVRIDATVVGRGEATSSAPAVSGELFVQDRFLDAPLPEAEDHQ